MPKRVVGGATLFYDGLPVEPASYTVAEAVEDWLKSGLRSRSRNGQEEHDLGTHPRDPQSWGPETAGAQRRGCRPLARR